MSRSTVTLMEALQRLLDATKQIDFADCKDERVWQAIGAAQGTAEGVLRDYVEQEPAGWIAPRLLESLANYREAAPMPSNFSVAVQAGQRETWDVALYAAPVAAQPAVVAASDWQSIPGGLERLVLPAAPLHEAGNAAPVQTAPSDKVIRMLASASGQLEDHDAEWSFTDTALIAFAHAILEASQQTAAAPFVHAPYGFEINEYGDSVPVAAPSIAAPTEVERDIIAPEDAHQLWTKSTQPLRVLATVEDMRKSLIDAEEQAEMEIAIGSGDWWQLKAAKIREGIESYPERRIAAIATGEKK